MQGQTYFTLSDDPGLMCDYNQPIIVAIPLDTLIPSDPLRLR